MYRDTVDLYAYFRIPREGRAGGYLSVTVPECGSVAKKLRPAALIFPGGGYNFLSPREGEPVELQFLARGYAAFRLDYTVNTPHPVPLLEAAMAAAYIRERAGDLSVGPLVAVGFSAGGHLAGTLATMYGDPYIKEVLGERNVRPDAAALCYAVLTTDYNTHGGTAQIISGGDEELKKQLSVVERITPDCPPVFLWHTADDGAVSVQNSLRAAEKLAACKVPFELHVFGSGVHGLSVCSVETADDENDVRVNPAAAQWLPLLFTWLLSRGFAVRKA